MLGDGQTQRVGLVVLKAEFTDLAETLVATEVPNEVFEAASYLVNVARRDLGPLVANNKVLKELLADVGEGGIVQGDFDGAGGLTFLKELEVLALR